MERLVGEPLLEDLALVDAAQGEHHARQVGVSGNAGRPRLDEFPLVTASTDAPLRGGRRPGPSNGVGHECARDLPVLGVDRVEQAHPVDLVALAPEESLCRRSMKADLRVLSHHEDDVGGVLDQRAETRLVRAGRALGSEPRPGPHGNELPREGGRRQGHAHKNQDAHVQAEPAGDRLEQDDQANGSGDGGDEGSSRLRCNLRCRGIRALPPLRVRGRPEDEPGDVEQGRRARARGSRGAEENVVPEEPIGAEADRQPEPEQHHRHRYPPGRAQAGDGQGHDQRHVGDHVSNRRERLHLPSRVGERRLDEELPGQHPAPKRDHCGVEPEGGPLVPGAPPAAQGEQADERERVAGEVEHIRRRGTDETTHVRDLQQEIGRVSQPENGEGPSQPSPSATQRRGDRRLVRGPTAQPDGPHAGDESPQVTEDVQDGSAGGPQRPAGEGDHVGRQEDDGQPAFPHQECGRVGDSRRLPVCLARRGPTRRRATEAESLTGIRTPGGLSFARHIRDTEESRERAKVPGPGDPVPEKHDGEPSVGSLSAEGLRWGTRLQVSRPAGLVRQGCWMTTQSGERPAQRRATCA